jgi:hypothetical protein
MVFHSLRAERMEDRWQLSIKGKIVAPDSYTVQKNFNQFYSQFRDSPIFSNIELMPLNISRFKEGEGAIAHTSYEKGEKSKTEFEIKFQLKEETVER